jgi:hypothetical protein
MQIVTDNLKIDLQQIHFKWLAAIDVQLMWAAFTAPRRQANLEGAILAGADFRWLDWLWSVETCDSRPRKAQLKDPGRHHDRFND